MASSGSTLTPGLSTLVFCGLIYVLLISLILFFLKPFGG